MLRRRVAAPVVAPSDAPAELLDTAAAVWESFDETKAWCERYGLSNGHFRVFGTLKFADWGYLDSCQVPHTVQRRLRKRLDGIEIPAGSGRDQEAARDA